MRASRGPNSGTGGAGTPQVFPQIRHARIVTGDVVLPNTAGAWQTLTGFTHSCPADVGDYAELLIAGMISPVSTSFFDVAVMVAGAPVRCASSDTAAPATEGWTALYKDPATFRTAGPVFAFTVGAGDLEGGAVNVALRVKAAGAGTVYASQDTYEWAWRLRTERATLA